MRHAEFDHFQKTLRREIHMEGIALHSGRNCQILIEPALPNTGIIFVRTDLPGAPRVPATIDHVFDTRMATTLAKHGVHVGTVEHLLAAFKLLEIDNAVVSVNAPELPILDGSAKGFLDAILNVGVFVQSVQRKVVRLKNAVEVRRDGKFARVEPSNSLSIEATVAWDHAAIGEQKFKFECGKNDASEIASARTFGFLKDVAAMKKAGLARGGSLENAIVLDDDKVLNPEGLRFQDEFVRHKVLDAFGDFALAPLPFLGKITLYKAGHELHAELMKAIFSDASQLEWLDKSAYSATSPTLWYAAASVEFAR